MKSAKCTASNSSNSSTASGASGVGTLGIKNSPRISVHVGTHFQKEKAKRRNTEDLFKDYSEKIIASGYRAYLRGDRLDECEKRFEQFVEHSKNSRPEGNHKSKSPSRLRRLEGRCVWALTLRENISRFVLSLCRLDRNVRRRG